MKTLKELYSRLNTAKDFKEMYPNYNEDDTKLMGVVFRPAWMEPDITG